MHAPECAHVRVCARARVRVCVYLRMRMRVSMRVTHTHTRTHDQGENQCMCVCVQAPVRAHTCGIPREWVGNKSPLCDRSADVSAITHPRRADARARPIERRAPVHHPVCCQAE